MVPHDGLVHISELAEERIDKVTDVVKEGQTVKVKLVAIDNYYDFCAASFPTSSKR